MAKPRSIFEEVEGERSASPQGGMIDKAPKGARGAIRIWLAVMFVMVFAIILVGGATRLTDSGLSITEWRPVAGALPPLTEADWQVEFDKYRQSPQYEHLNKGMELSSFKFIFWWEWGHRQLARVLGLVWGLGFLYFWATKRIPTGWTKRLLLIGGPGALQGAVGWWMVSSGLVGTMTTVASYRLATHLGLAFVIFGFLGWYVFLLGRTEADLMQARRSREAKLFSMSTGLMHFAFLQIILGALVAGIDAGRAFPTWPDMNGEFFPSNGFYVPEGGAVWRAFFENEGLVQFMHRMAGYLLAIFAFVVWRRSRKSPHQETRKAFDLIALMMVGQVALGIAAVLTAAHLHTALTHQAGAVILWVLILRGRYLAQYPIAGSIRKGTA